MACPTPQRHPSTRGGTRIRARASGWLGLGLALALALALALPFATGCGKTPRGIPPDALQLADLDGLRGPPALDGDTRVAVFVFLGIECPIANRCLPALAQLEGELAPHGVAFFHVYPNADETPEAIRRHRREFNLGPRAYRDPGLVTARALGAIRTPEAIALTPAGELVYRGRINDQYSALGVGRPAPTRHDLKEALDTFLADGRATGRTEPGPGCTFRTPP